MDTAPSRIPKTESYRCQWQRGAQSPRSCCKAHKSAAAAQRCAERGAGRPGLTGDKLRAEVRRGDVLVSLSYGGEVLSGRATRDDLAFTWRAAWVRIPVEAGVPDPAALARATAPGLVDRMRVYVQQHPGSTPQAVAVAFQEEIRAELRRRRAEQAGGTAATEGA